MSIQMGEAVELIVEPPPMPTFEVEVPTVPDLVIVPVPGARGESNYDHIPDLTLIFENGLI